MVDCTTKKQISCNIYRTRTDDTQTSKARDYLINKLNIKDNGFAFTKPYQSTKTRPTTINTHKEGNKLFTVLSSELGLQKNTRNNKTNIQNKGFGDQEADCEQGWNSSAWKRDLLMEWNKAAIKVRFELQGPPVGAHFVENSEV